jgi:hypothetical protein
MIAAIWRARTSMGGRLEALPLKDVYLRDIPAATAAILPGRALDPLGLGDARFY